MNSEVSVVICCYTSERWGYLVDAVRSIQHQSRPALEIIVVVDHNPELLAQVKSELPEVIAVPNTSTNGLSGARNTGIATSKGEKIIFLDDDAAAAADWLALLSDWCDEPNVMGTGGQVLPRWQVECPRWFPDEFNWVVGCSYRGMPETAAPIRNLMGGAMCIRRELFDAVGGFREDVGRVGTIPLGCEETELCIRARQHWPDTIFIYEPLAVTHHQVTASRARWSYFRNRCFAEGFSKALISQFVGSGDALSSERTYTLRTLPQGVINGLRDALLRRDWSGLGRAAAIVGGLFITTVGYGYGLVSLNLTNRKLVATAEAPTIRESV